MDKYVDNFKALYRFMAENAPDDEAPCDLMEALAAMDPPSRRNPFFPPEACQDSVLADFLKYR